MNKRLNNYVRAGRIMGRCSDGVVDKWIGGLVDKCRSVQQLGGVMEWWSGGLRQGHQTIGARAVLGSQRPRTFKAQAQVDLGAAFHSNVLRAPIPDRGSRSVLRGRGVAAVALLFSLVATTPQFALAQQLPAVSTAGTTTAS